MIRALVWKHYWPKARAPSTGLHHVRALVAQRASVFSMTSVSAPTWRTELQTMDTPAKPSARRFLVIRDSNFDIFVPEQRILAQRREVHQCLPAGESVALFT